MWRVWIAAVVLGGMLAFYGYKEVKVSSGASGKATEMNLAGLEKGEDLANPHIRLDAHWALYPVCIFEYEGVGQARDHHKVNYTYYPVISPEHPFLVTLAKLEEEYGDLDKAPEEKLPEIEDFAVLVKTKRFGTVGAIPDDILPAESVQGLVVNRISKLETEECRLLRESFPKINLDKVLLLDSDRRPTSVLGSYGLMLLGLLVVAGGIGAPFYLKRREGEAETRSAERHRQRTARAREIVQAARASGAMPGSPENAEGTAAPPPALPPAPPPAPPPRHRGPGLPGE